MTTATVQLPGLTAGAWAIDLAHSEVSFTVRHLMVSKVRGTFTKFEGTVNVADDVLASSVQATIHLDSIDTRDANRDNHLRSADFFEIEKYPTMTFQSTGIRAEGDHFVVEGDLSLHGVTKSVPLTLE